jgi:hypothetical protein
LLRYVWVYVMVFCGLGTVKLRLGNAAALSRLVQFRSASRVCGCPVRVVVLLLVFSVARLVSGRSFGCVSCVGRAVLFGR